MKNLWWLIEDYWHGYRRIFIIHVRAFFFVLVSASCFLLLPVTCFYVVALSAAQIEPGGLEFEFYYPIDGRVPGLMSPKWSPDSTRLTFGNTFGFKGEIYTIDVVTMHLQPVHGVGSNDPDAGSGVSADVASSPSISLDGSRVAYAAFEHSTWLPWVKDHNWEIVTSDLDGSGKRRLTEN